MAKTVKAKRGRGTPTKQKQKQKEKEKGASEQEKKGKGASSQKSTRKTGPFGTPAPSSPLMMIPDAGKEYYGLSVNGSYEAADRGDLGPVVEVGRRKYVTRAGVEQRIATLGKLPSPKVPATATVRKRKAAAEAAEAAEAAA
jgi:hypothetical protein